MTLNTRYLTELIRRCSDNRPGPVCAATSSFHVLDFT